MKNDKFVFFYGGVFSQWYPANFTIDEVQYATAEQYMMAKKAEYFEDEDTRIKIMATTDPSEQKALGRQVSNFDREAWDAVSRGFVYEANKAKFTQNPKLMDRLIDTAGKELVEASPYDKIWGIGLAFDDERANDKSQWRGTNWLGEVLTKLRDDLIKGVKNKGKEALKCKVQHPYSNKQITLKDYLKMQLNTLWQEGEGFSGKRPFGDSGWDYAIYEGIIKSGLSTGKLDDDGYVDDKGDAPDILFDAIEAL